MLLDSHRPCRRWLALFALAFLAGAGNAARVFAQGSNGLPGPHLTSIAPNGGQRGATLELTFAGQDVGSPESLLFNHAGLVAEPLYAPVDPKKPAPPAVRAFKIQIAPDAPLGTYDLRLVNRLGISNPVPFVVTDLQVIEEKENNDDVGTAQRVPLNCVVTGAIGSRVDVDYFVFNGTKGQRVLAQARTASIDSRLLAQLTLFDATGKQLGACRPIRYHDSLLDVTLPASGDYVLRVTEFAHMQGGPDYRYFLALGSFPCIDAVYPLAVEPGKKSKVTVFGRNLPGGVLDPTALDHGTALERTIMTIEAPRLEELRAATPGLGSVSNAAVFLPRFEFRAQNGVGVSNGFPMLLAQAPAVVEHEPNDTPETAQPLAVPCEVTGRLDHRSDHDWFSFSARKGDIFMIDVWSERLGVKTDLGLTVRDALKKTNLVELEDNPVSLSPTRFPTASTDPPAYRFVAPADGSYLVQVRGMEGQKLFGVRQFYHLRILREKPDFHLVVLPAEDARAGSNILHRGSCVRWQALIQREGGWNGPVELEVTGLPPGVLAHKQVIGAGAAQGSLVISSALDADRWAGEVQIHGHAQVDGKPVERQAFAAGIVTPSLNKQQADPPLTRVERNLVLAVGSRAPFSITSNGPNTITAGSKVELPLEVTRLAADFKAPVQIGPAEGPTGLPPGIIFNDQKPLAVAADKETAPATLEVKKSVAPGVYTVFLEGTAPYSVSNDPSGKAGAKVNVNAVFPASPITFTVLPAPPPAPAPAAKPAEKK